MRFVLRGLLAPRVGDLLEDLAHARAQELPVVRLGIVVAPMDAGLLARVEAGAVFGIGNVVGVRDIVRLHARIVAPRLADVNGPLTLSGDTSGMLAA